MSIVNQIKIEQKRAFLVDGGKPMVEMMLWKNTKGSYASHGERILTCIKKTLQGDPGDSHLR